MPTEEGERPSSFRSSALVRVTSVDAHSAYMESILSAGTHIGERFYVGASVPMVGTKVGEEKTTGLGNIVLVGNWSNPFWPTK